jgi:uncharacterized damage-inducible protein DinB
MDDDLLNLDQDGLRAEVKRLRGGIRAHRDSSGHELCWHHPQLWGLLPEKTDPLPEVPAWPQFLRGCLAYRESLDRELPRAPRTEVDFGKRDASVIADELTRAVEGDPWHGDSVSVMLRGVTATAAAAKPRDDVHSIWEIVRHMTAWTNEVARRLDGHAAGEPQEGDWPQPAGQSEDDWKRDVAAFIDANRRLVEKVKTLPDDRLRAPSLDYRDRAAGTGVPYDVMLHGLAQHHAYHAGQIALLKKLTART